MRLIQTALLAAALMGACSSPTAPGLPAGAVQISGTVRYVALEGGFWAVRGDDGVTYEPLNGLAAAYQRENLRVTLVGKVRSDVGGIHMAGPIIEVLSIQTP